MEVAKFIKYAKELKDVTVYAVSMDLPFALDRWCQAKNNENVITLSDYKYHSFANATATYVEELGLLTRAVFIVDDENTIRYVEYVNEITEEPNYDAVLACIKGL
ncbi:MAG: redoxin family protein [Clostridium sp.]